MDGQTLQQLFAGSNPFLAQMGEQAFNLDQQKKQADLASVLGVEKRANEMQPVEIASRKAGTRLNESTAGLNEYSLATKLPKEEALKLNMQKFFKESDELTQEQTRMQVQRMMQLAQMAKANGGALPQGFNIPPEEMDRYSPANLDKTIKYGEMFFASDPKEIAARQRAKEQKEQAIAAAAEAGKWKVQAKETPSGNTTPTPGVPTSYGEVLQGMAKYKEPHQKLGYLKSILPAVSPELQLQLKPAYDSIKTQAEGIANKQMAGQIDVSGATKGRVPVNPPVNMGESPGANVSAKPQYTQADLEFTAKKYNMTVEQVKKQLGIK